MKEQYVGDINDYRKYALLRRLQAGSGLRFGVCWMLTPSDGRSDGNKTSYLGRLDNAQHDPKLFGLLRSVVADTDDRRLIHIQESGILPRTTFDNSVVPDPLPARTAWFLEVKASLSRCELLFFDPDNGLDVPSKQKGAAGSSKYLFRDEVAASYAAGHSVMLYQHFPREERNGFIARVLADLRVAAPGAAVWEFRTGNVAFLLLVRPDHQSRLQAAVASVANFDPRFIEVRSQQSVVDAVPG